MTIHVGQKPNPGKSRKIITLSLTKEKVTQFQTINNMFRVNSFKKYLPLHRNP